MTRDSTDLPPAHSHSGICVQNGNQYRDALILASFVALSVFQCRTPMALLASGPMYKAGGFIGTKSYIHRHKH